MENSQFNLLDVTLAIVLISSGIFAFRRGLIREVMALGTWVLASVFAFSFYPVARPLLEAQIKNQMLADAATAIGLFCIAIVTLVPLGDYLSGLVKTPTLSSIDRSLGFVFGIIRGFIIMCLLYLGTTYVWPEDQEDKEDSQPKWLVESKTKPALAYGVDLLKSVVPEDAEEQAAEALRKSREKAVEAAEDAKRLDEISVPVPAYTNKNEKPSSYQDDSRDKMNNLIDRN